MKKLMLTLSTLTASTILALPIVATSIFNAPTIKNSNRNKINDKNQLSNNLLSNYDPSHSDITGSVSVKTHIRDYKKAWWSSLENDDVSTWTLDVSNYGFSSISDFISNYGSITFSNVYANWISDGWSINDSKSSNFTLNLSTEGISYEKYFSDSKSGSQNSAKGSAEYKYSCSGTKITFSFKSYIYIYQGGNSSKTWSETTFNIGNFSLTSSSSNLASGLKEAVGKTFSLTSTTSTSISSTETKSITEGKEVTSNHDAIAAEFLSRIKSQLGTDYNEWCKVVNLDISNLTFDETNKKVYMNIADIGTNAFCSKGLFPSKIEMPITLSFDSNGMISKIKSVFEKTFTMTSDTSPNISDTETIGTSGTVTSNHDQVANEIDLRLKTIFGNKYSEWASLLKTSNRSYDDSKSSVTISFSDQGGSFISEGQWVSSVTMPVKVNLSSAYYEMGVKKRLLVEPGKIIDSTSSTNELINDRPSYDADSKTWTYHNQLNLTFTSTKGSNELLIVNGTAVPVYDNIFRISLKDQREDTLTTDSKPTSYSISITKDGETELEFNISIDSVSDDMKYKWVGWNPQNDVSQPTYYEQYLLTQEKIKDSEGNMVENPKYNANIDSETGMISNLIFVKNDTGQDYPFAVDPLDSDGNKIDSSTATSSSYNYGYIAEALVANSGIQNLFTSQDNIAKIERVQLNTSDLSEISGTKEVVDMSEAQFSTAGLYHYIIYQKNYVEKELDPKETYTETTPATAGSTIHKLVYISNSVADYGNDFLSMDFVKSNANISAFWTSIQSKHLKNFLIPLGVDSTTLKLASYQQIISYWYEYISNVQHDTNVPIPTAYIDLSTKSAPDTLKINLSDEASLKTKIKLYVQTYINNLSLSLEYQSDYIITDSASSTKDLQQISLSDLANITTTTKTQNLYIVSLSTSTKLVGIRSFQIVNSSSFNPSEIIDLSLISLSDMKYNFSETTYKKFRDSYILENVKSILSDNLTSGTSFSLEYGVDYIISLNSSSKDFKEDETSETIIQSFLETDEAELTINIISLDSSTKLSGHTSQLFINSFSEPTPPTIKIDIATIFRNLNLGEVDEKNSKGYIDNKIIWKYLCAKNDISSYSDLIIDDLSFSIISLGDNTYKATITVLTSNEKYKGTVDAKYTSQYSPDPDLKKIDIASIFRNLNLGEIDEKNSNGYIDNTIIWKYLCAKNDISSYSDLTIDDLSFSIISQGLGTYKATITVLTSNETYKGTVDAKYTSQYSPDPDLKKIDIASIFRNLNLGEIDEKNSKGYIDNTIIWKYLCAKNDISSYSDLIIDDLSFSIISLGNNTYKATITVLTSNEKYKGTVDAKYTSQYSPSPNPIDPSNDKFNTKNLFWIIPLVFIFTVGIGMVIWYFLRKKTTKKRIK